MKTKHQTTAVLALCACFTLASCSSPFADQDDSFSRGQALAMERQQENQARASAYMAGRSPQRLAPITPIAAP